MEKVRVKILWGGMTAKEINNVPKPNPNDPEKSDRVFSIDITEAKKKLEQEIEAGLHGCVWHAEVSYLYDREYSAEIIDPERLVIKILNY